MPAADQPGDDLASRMAGSVTKVSEGVINPEMAQFLQAFPKPPSTAEVRFRGFYMSAYK